MPNKAKNLSKLLRLPLLLGLFISACSSPSPQKEKRLSNREILNKMVHEFILDEEFEAGYSQAAPPPQQLSHPQRPALVQSFPSTKPASILLSLREKEHPLGPGIDLQMEALLPQGIKIGVESTNQSGYILLKTSAKIFSGKYGYLTLPITYRDAETRNFRTTFHSTGELSKTYKNQAVEFINPSVQAIYSNPFHHSYESGKLHILVWHVRRSNKSPEAIHSPSSQIFKTEKIELIPYTEEALHAIIEQTSASDALHQVAQRLLKQLRL